MKSPAGNPPGRRIWEVEMLTHLYLLLLIKAIVRLRHYHRQAVRVWPVLERSWPLPVWPEPPRKPPSHSPGMLPAVTSVIVRATDPLHEAMRPQR